MHIKSIRPQHFLNQIIYYWINFYWLYWHLFFSFIVLFHWLLFFFQISYSLKDDHGTFSIAPNTGDIKLLRELDRETRDHYLVTVTATDNGAYRLSSKVEVTTFFSSTELIITYYQWSTDWHVQRKMDFEPRIKWITTFISPCLGFCQNPWCKRQFSCVHAWFICPKSVRKCSGWDHRPSCQS